MSSEQHFNEDLPLGEAFEQNPYQYVQQFIRNMNNEMFLSEYHLNNLYALLLIGRVSPWDQLKPYDSSYKQKIDEIVNKKVEQVKFLLNNVSQVYQEKVRKSTFNRIQKLMDILQAKNKSIFIQKNFMKRCEQEKMQAFEENNREMLENIKNSETPQTQNKQQLELKTQIPLETEKKGENQTQNMNDNKQLNNQQGFQTRNEQQAIGSRQSRKTSSNGEQSHIEHKQQQNHHCGHMSNQTEDFSVLHIFAGLSHLPSLSTMALQNCLDYNSEQRFIKFGMGKNYIMTIKNQDPLSFDLTSQLSQVSPALLIHNIFPFLTAFELFRVRSVCKEWLVHVKESWHSTFKRQMYVQLLAAEFCKQIQFFYKCIQLRNPFFQKLSLLLHALIQIIEWEMIIQMVNANNLNIALKRVLMLLLKFMGQLQPLPNIPLVFASINQLSNELFEHNKHKIVDLKLILQEFFNNLRGSQMSIDQLRTLKSNFLDHPLLRADELQTQQKTPLLLLLFVKQLNLQQILKNHLYFSQQYLLNSKNRLDDISRKMPHHKGFLEGVYKVLLLKKASGLVAEKPDQEEQSNEMPSFQEMISSVFENKQTGRPDFTIKTKNSKTNIYMDKATKFDIIVSTVRKLNPRSEEDRQCKFFGEDEEIEQKKEEIEENSTEKEQKQRQIEPRENGQEFQDEKQ